MRHWKYTALAAVLTAALALPMQGAEATGCKKKRKKRRQPACELVVPAGQVDVCVEVGDVSYLVHILSGAKDLNGVYEAWCVDVFGGISVDCYGVELVSSLDSKANEVIAAPRNWDLINYLLNEVPHYRDVNGASKYDLQWVFWKLSDPTATPSEIPDDQGLADAILAEVKAQGAGFVPTEGQLAAVVMLHADPSLQETIVGVRVVCKKKRCKPRCAKRCAKRCKSDKSGKQCKSGKSGKSDKSGKQCKSGKSGKSGKQCKSGKSGKQQKRGKSDKSGKRCK